MAASYGHLKALVVEDNPHMRAILRAILMGLGVSEVHEAPDGGQAFRVLKRIEPDFVLTDMMMAPVDGIAFVRELRNSPQSPNPFLPVIMVSGHTERARILAARDAGVTEFVAKPITANNLFLRIVEIVERPRPFVRAPSYFGPDRRRKNDAFHVGPWRREEDRARDLVAV
jgi:two-component system, chemotaxis family, chemotaxis protein CheY